MAQTNTETNKTNSLPLKLVVIGNGMASIRTLEELLQAAPDAYKITVIGREPFGSYNRIMLSPMLAGETTQEEIMIHDRPWYEEQGIELLAGDEYEALHIDRSNHQVQLRNGDKINYDRILIATGADPIRLPVPGADAEGVLCFRGIRDVEAMLERSRDGQHAVVIGAGLLGLEAANGLVKRGMNVTVIHRARYPLNRQLDKEAAQLLQRELESRGIEFRLGVNTHSILTKPDDDGNQEVISLKLDSGEILPADMVVMATGIRPNIELAHNSGIECNHGILVNDCLQSFDPAIYAVGECVEHRAVTFGLVEPLFEQARVCANHLASHGVASYTYLKPATRLKVSGISLYSMGDYDLSPDKDGDDIELLTLKDFSAGIYKKLVIKENKLVGAVLYGDTVDGPWYHELMRDERDISRFRDGLIFGQEPEDAA
ncbi:MAG: FAD-dependent oxidoreductase [Motiliproteus sp.]|nr:FAD-dependent oxidoreductase [Motiliproteus sp.]MCW9054033.1 FAD-dependent oxidoreductase [Motiliproteus sp.]